MILGSDDLSMGLLWNLTILFFAVKTVLNFYPEFYEVARETRRKLDGISLIFFFMFYVNALIETFGPQQPLPSKIKEKKMDLDPQQPEKPLRRPLLSNSQPSNKSNNSCI